MQHTTNYNLNQWEDGDVVRREDFNADNAAIDAALKSVSDAAANAPEIVIGYYVGNGNASQNINLGRKPKAVLVEAENGLRGANVSSGPYGGLATTITGVSARTSVSVRYFAAAGCIRLILRRTSRQRRIEADVKASAGVRRTEALRLRSECSMPVKPSKRQLCTPA